MTILTETLFETLFLLKKTECIAWCCNHLLKDLLADSFSLRLKLAVSCLWRQLGTSIPCQGSGNKFYLQHTFHVLKQQLIFPHYKQGQGDPEDHLHALGQEAVHDPAGQDEGEAGGEEGQEPAARVQVGVNCLVENLFVYIIWNYFRNSHFC